MYYFTDLDRTLIYSKKFLDDNSKGICVEKYNGEDISYMTNKAVEQLITILNSKIVIPTTTRSIEQYERIEFAKNNIVFNWAIVCNGGCIIHNGERLKEWDNIIEEKLKYCGSFEEVRKSFEHYENVAGILKVREIYNMFFYMVVNKEEFIKESIEAFVKFLEKENWNVYYSGRKIYFIPNAIKKEEAIKFIVEKLKIKSFTALGDSIMDEGMLEIADNAIVPKGSFLTDYYEMDNRKYNPEKEGLQGLEEILEVILSGV